MLTGAVDVLPQESSPDIKTLVASIKELTASINPVTGHEQYLAVYEKFRAQLEDKVVGNLILREYFFRSQEEYFYCQTQSIALKLDLEQTNNIFFGYQKKISCTYFFMKYVLPKFKSTDKEIQNLYLELLLSNMMNYYTFGQALLDYSYPKETTQEKQSVQKLRGDIFFVLRNYYYIFNQYQMEMGRFLEDVLYERIEMSDMVLAKCRINLYQNYTHLIKVNCFYFIWCNEFDSANCDYKTFVLTRFAVAFVKTQAEKIAQVSSCSFKKLKQDAQNFLNYINKISNDCQVNEMLAYELSWVQLDSFAARIERTLDDMQQFSFRANLNFTSIEMNVLKRQIESMMSKDNNALLGSPQEKSDFSKSLEFCAHLRKCSRDQARQLLPAMQQLLAKWAGIFKKADSPYSILNSVILDKLRFRMIQISLKLSEKVNAENKTVVQSLPEQKNNRDTKAVSIAAISPKTSMVGQSATPNTNETMQVVYYQSTNTELYSDIKRIKEPKVKTEHKSQKPFVGNVKNNTKSDNTTKKAAQHKKQEKPKNVSQNNNNSNQISEKKNKAHLMEKEDPYLSREGIAKLYDKAKNYVKPLKPQIKEALIVKQPKTQEASLIEQMQQLSVVDTNLPYKPTDRIIVIDPQVKAILTTLNDFGYWAVVRGGAVRDSVLGLEVADWDISTNCPNELLRGFIPQARVNLQDEMLRQFKVENKIDITCTTLSLEEELELQDFYENTLCADCEGRVYDILNVLSFFKEDSTIKELHVIPKANNATVYDRFAEDPTILMRYFRLSEKLNWNISLNFKALSKIVGFLTNIQHGKYFSNFAKLFNSGKAAKLWDNLASFNLTHSFLPGAELITYSYDLSFISKFIRNKFRLIDQCSKELREQQYGFYHSVSLLLLPQLVERLCKDPNGTIDKQVEDTIEFYCNNFRGEFKEGDKHCFRVNVKPVMTNYYLECWQSSYRAQANTQRKVTCIETNNKSMQLDEKEQQALYMQ